MSDEETETPSHLVMLNPEQYRAVTTLEGPLLILAGAGSGKTRVLTRRVAHLLHTGVDAKNILAVTFTNKAAAEMKERIAELLVKSMGEGGEEVAKKVWVSTFHSSCGRILRTDIEHLGHWTRRFAIYDDDDQIRLLKEIVRAENIDSDEYSPKKLLAKIDHHKGRLETVEDVLRQKRSHLNHPLIRVWREYEASMKAADAVDFNDLIGLTVQLLEEHPDVLDKWRSRFHYVMVDEYQDTNQQQYRLLRALAPDPTSNLGVVGDDDQSIYGFRGADVTNILNFERDYPGATVIKLEQNYRSSGNILEFSNRVVAANSGRLDKKLWTAAGPGTKVHLRRHRTPEDEAKYVGDAIQKLIQRRGVKAEDVAIIYRTNATSRVFEAALKRRSLPYKIVGGRKFYERREVRDVLAYLRLVVNPADDLAFLRIINVPSRGIGAKSLAKVREAAEKRGVPMMAAARGMSSGSSAIGKKLAPFVKLIEELAHDARSLAPAALVAEVVEKSGYGASLLASGEEEKKRLENLQELAADAGLQQASEEAPSPMDLLRLYLDRVALAGMDEELPEGGQVTMMTVHCAKGLEYPVVFAVQMMEGSFPHARSLEERDGVEEERRLAYVAFTRAKEELFITRSQAAPVWVKRRGPSAEGKPVAPSRFLQHATDDICEGVFPAEDEPQERDFIPDDAPTERRPVARKKLAAFNAVSAQRFEAFRPPGDASFMEVTELEQLAPGTLVHHPREGYGRILRVSTKGTYPSVHVEVEPGRARTRRWNGTELEIVVE